MQQIGGDFYIASRDVFSGRYLIAVGDATGHGVASAILASIFGATIQNFFLQNPRQSAQALLMRVHAFASRLLISQEADKSSIREGCDVAVLIFDISQQKVEVGLAGRPLWIWEPQGGLQELEGGRRGIDSFTPSDYEFPTYTLPLSPQSVFYLFTDGLTDVLNPQGRRWGIRRLRELISELARQGLSPDAQMEAILRALQNWREEAQANDDITFLIVPAQSILTRVGTQTPHSA
jgi:sigma-B regulation protein RsbU (phosphoserine phosphatase)